MPTILTTIREQLEAKSIDPRTAKGRSWLLQQVKNLRPTPATLFSDKQALRTRTMIGRMYFFYYTAKSKDILPYWDRLPLVIPIQRYDDGFLGINFHYIPPKDRLILLKKLSQYATGSYNDERTRLRLTYPILQATHKAYEATPCIKRYLYPHIKSRFMEIPATEWDIAASLPFQRFTGKEYRSSQVVWQESKEKY